MAKPRKEMILDPQRCEVCATTLTLYPVNFTSCPHCQKKVCRRCWGEAWAAKAFSAEECSHPKDNVNPTVSPVAVAEAGNFDWHRAAAIGVMVLVGLGVVIFLLDLLAF